MAEPLNILIVATKPPWPPVDGGRVVVLNTVDALAAAGHRVTLVAPVDPAADPAAAQEAFTGRCRAELVAVRPPGVRRAALSSLLRGRPLTVERHRLAPVAERVRRLVARETFDVVQAEQLQAVAQAAPAVASGAPLVYRAHNIESVLWTYAASFARPFERILLRREARRLATFERATIRRGAATVVLTELDLMPLRRSVGPGPRIERVPVPFAPQMAPSRVPLAGAPAVVTLASPTWPPSREAVLQVARQWWPAIRRRVPEAVLHVFGGVDGGPLDGVEWHPAPAGSASAFAAGAVVAIPARHPTGIPVKGLEAWARGLPLIGSAQTAEALEAVAGRELIVADDPEAFAASLQQLASDPALRARVVEGGRARLRSQHDPAQVAAQLALSGSRDDWTTVSTATISGAAGLSGVAAFRFVAHQGFDFVGINGAMQRRFAGTEQASQDGPRLESAASPVDRRRELAYTPARAELSAVRAGQVPRASGTARNDGRGRRRKVHGATVVTPSPGARMTPITATPLHGSTLRLGDPLRGRSPRRS